MGCSQQGPPRLCWPGVQGLQLGPNDLSALQHAAALRQADGCAAVEALGRRNLRLPRLSWPMAGMAFSCCLAPPASWLFASALAFESVFVVLMVLWTLLASFPC